MVSGRRRALPCQDASVRSDSAPMTAPLHGKTIFITGASRGIGRAIALKCARDGANIVIAAKTDTPNPKLPGTIHSVAEEVREAGGQALALAVDVRDDERLSGAIKAAAEHFGGLDILVNNAGAISLTPCEFTPLKRVDLMFGVNIRASYAAAHFAIPYLKKSANAHILSLSPPIDMDPRWFRNHTAYTISKYGMTMATIGLAGELAGAGIAVNSLWPKTIIETAALKMVGGEMLGQQARTPEIMADAAYAIFSTNSRELTGQQLIDEPFLRSRGVTDFDHYAVSPGSPLLTDLFVTPDL